MQIGKGRKAKRRKTKRREIRPRYVWENTVFVCETSHRRDYTKCKSQKTSSSTMLLTVLQDGEVWRSGKNTDVSEALNPSVSAGDSAFLA